MDNALLVLQGEVVDALQHADEFGELLCGVFLPALLGRLLVIGSGSDEEERAQGPQFVDEADAVFHHACHLQNALWRLFRAMLLDEGQEEGGNLLVRLLEDVFVVEPDSLLVGELGTGLGTLGDVEEGHELV